MTTEKENLLDKTYRRFLNATLYAIPDDLEELFDRNCMGFGTTIDEKLFSLPDMIKLVEIQRELSRGMEMSHESTLLFRKISQKEDIAVIAEDIILKLKISDDTVSIYLRLSVVFEFINKKWMAIHFHGSKPENIQSEVDTFGIEEWKQKNAKLEKLVAERTNELVLKNQEMETTLSELKSTQNQLVQKEKLASLGELTAGIAHEIQNPLNFVNNFSELSVDIVKDLNQEVFKENVDKDYVKELMSDLTDNQEKINHHGKRASSIVKGMLEHSRTSTGEREPTDINKLADEYLRLSYHGLRAKDKNFNSDYKTDFDETLPKINIVPQDIGRVLLNLINNAFYAVNERAKYEQGRHIGVPLPIYAPLVSVSTKKIGNKIEIIVKDNGNGIPDKIKEKIFQPFFTTKPTGEGTGLGLSLAYDIIMKGYGGSVSVQSVEGEGSEFVIHLPNK